MKIIFILILVATIFMPIPAFAENLKIATSQTTHIIKTGIFKNAKAKNEESLLKKSWNFIKGEPIDNSIDLGMLSFHTRSDRADMNETNNLLSVNFKGYTIGTLNNSYHKQTYFMGIGRKIYEHNLPKDFNLQLKYKLIGLHGYQDYHPDIAGITPLILPIIGISRGHFGLDFLISPGKTVTFATSLRINL